MVHGDGAVPKPRVDLNTCCSNRNFCFHSMPVSCASAVRSGTTLNLTFRTCGWRQGRQGKWTGASAEPSAGPHLCMSLLLGQGVRDTVAPRRSPSAAFQCSVTTAWLSPPRLRTLHRVGRGCRVAAPWLACKERPPRAAVGAEV